MNLYAHERTSASHFHTVSTFVIVRYVQSNPFLFICPQERTPSGKSGVPGMGGQHCLKTRVILGGSNSVLEH